MIISDLTHKLSKIADSYAEKALNARSAKDALRAITIVEKATRLGIEISEKYSPKFAGLGAFFEYYLQTNPRRVLRSQVWRDYVSFCSENGHQIMRKGSFFEHALAIGCKEVKDANFYYIFPDFGVKRLAEIRKNVATFGEIETKPSIQED